MRLFEAFKTTWGKVVVALLVTLGWILLYNKVVGSTVCMCDINSINCIDYSSYSLVSFGCRCDCIGILEVIAVNALHIFIPFFITLVFLSIAKFVLLGKKAQRKKAEAGKEKAEPTKTPKQ